MNHYFNVEATSPSNVSYGYCGDDRYCSLPQSLPSEDRALGSIRLPASMSRAGIEAFLYQAFTSLAAANPGHRIIVRWAEDNTVTAWMFPLREAGKRSRRIIRCSRPGRPCRLAEESGQRGRPGG
jgi:hypothetical protein